MLDNLITRIRSHRDARRIRAAVRHLDPHILRDIGITDDMVPRHRGTPDGVGHWR